MQLQLYANDALIRASVCVHKVDIEQVNWLGSVNICYTTVGLHTGILPVVPIWLQFIGKRSMIQHHQLMVL